MSLNKDLIKIYEECSNGYHKVDDFRAKLLGFLPLASGIAILGTLYAEEKNDSVHFLTDHHFAIGIFGFIVTLGLLVYELKGIEKCTQFIMLGKWIEDQMEDNTVNGVIKKGYFTELLKGNKYINEPVASAIIYSIVLALWSYVTFMEVCHLQYIMPPLVFLTFFIIVVTYWRSIFKPA